MKNTKKRISSITALLAAAIGSALCSPLMAYATGAVPKLQDAADKIQATGVLVARIACIVILVACGFVLMIGGRQGREFVKWQLLAVVAGIVLIVFAFSFTDTFFNWVQ